MKPLAANLCLVLLLMLFARPVNAHRVDLVAVVEAGRIVTESRYPDGRVLTNGRVRVYDSAGQVLLSGTTDQQGKFTAPIPKLEELRIVIDDRLGHRTEIRLEKSDLEAGR